MEHPFFIPNPNLTEAALRWLSIAEKLLANRDLMGSKSFATRAQESDPTLVHGGQILAIIDTLLAGDKLINNQLDYYGILQVPPDQTHDSDLISNQYRRLAVLLDPRKNSFPYADQAFRLVFDAWNVLSDPMRKSMYDKELGFFINLNPNPVSAALNPIPPQQQQPNAFTVVSNSGREQQQQAPPQQMFFTSREQQQQQSFASGQPLTFPSREPVQQHPVHQQPVQQHPVHQQPVQQHPVHQQQVQTMAFLQQPFSGRDQQQPQPQQAQPFTFLNRQQSPQVTSIPRMNVDKLPTVTPMPGLSREPQPFSFGPSSSHAQLPQVSPTENSSLYDERNEQNVGFEGNNLSDDNVNQPKEKEGEVDETNNVELNEDEPKNDIPSFWTACPYCYHMFEYPEAYVDCTLRCQNCKMAFQAVVISSPPPIIDGKEAYFCCWGFLPLGFSVSIWEKYKDKATSWTPFSPMFSTPQAGGANVGNVYHSVVRPGNVNNRSGYGGSGVKKQHQKVIVDDDVYVNLLSDSNDESDVEWRNESSTKRKKAKRVKGKVRVTGTPKTTRKIQSENGKNVKANNAGDSFQNGPRMPAEKVKKGVVNNIRRQSGSAAKGKLDLNVEFSNEVEEPPPVMNGQMGRGEEDGIEGNGFFEGLDEFLSSLPILNAVGDENKVKAA
ncbi:unnamed protein product [Cuscuta epithymum]|uniref:J domain-containing protein n=1 Tax=Cuscuta epithymum TaxID=186058 RepID=A0AAV0F544_9ASTE|nr:unnamed protein product [Cuscuta epithymum]